MLNFIFDILRILLISRKPGGVKVLVSEICFLRNQLEILKRLHNIKKCPPLKTNDRIFFSIIAKFLRLDRLVRSALLVKPVTILKFHQSLVKRKYKLLYSNKVKKKPGPKGPSDELVRIVLEVKENNPHMGSPQIADFVNDNFVIQTDKSTVRRILKKHLKPDPNSHGPSWLTFIGNCTDNLWSMDFFKVESILLKTHWVMLVMDQYTRRIVGVAVYQGNLNGKVICSQFNRIASGQKYPKYLSMDNDPLFRFHHWRAKLRIFEIEEIHSIPDMPWSHPFIESLIKTIRTEFTNRILFWNARDLERKLDSYIEYYNKHRVHSSIEKTPPLKFMNDAKKKRLKTSNYKWKKLCHGLFQVPVAA